MIRNRTGELVVKPRYSPRFRLFLAGLIVVGVFAAGAAIYNHGLSMAGFDRAFTLTRNRELQDDIKFFESKLCDELSEPQIKELFNELIDNKYEMIIEKYANCDLNKLSKKEQDRKSVV